MGISLSHLSYTLGGVYTGLGDGTADTFGLNYRYPLVRTPLMNVTFLARAERKQLKDHNPSAENNRHSDVGTLGITAAGADASGVSTAYVNVAGGRVSFDDAGAEALDQAEGGLHVKGGFSKLAYGVNRQQRLADQFFLYGNLSGQVAGDHRLDSSERMSLGGPAAVRAYPIGETTGDSGYVATAELRYFPARLANSQFALFYDAGRITRDANIDRAADSDGKRGYGIAAGYGYGPVQLRGSLAWRSSGKAASDPAAKGQQLYLQLSTSF